MPLHLSATPCPLPVSRPGTLRTMHDQDDTFVGKSTTGFCPTGFGVHFEDDDLDGDTENVDFTTEIRAAFRNAAPRRRKTTQRKPVEIHEDAEPPVHQPKSSMRPRRSSMRHTAINENQTLGASFLTKPAQRIPLIPEAKHAVAKPSRRRVSAILAERQANPMDKIVETDQFDNSLFDIFVPQKASQSRKSEAISVERDPRRRTIYVPSDETSIFTIHPGASLNVDPKSRVAPKDLNMDLMAVSEGEEEDKAIQQKRKMARKSLAAAPRRAPLGQVSRPLQGRTHDHDLYGAGGGKENVPPGRPELAKKKDSKIVITINDHRQPAKPHSREVEKAPLKASRAQIVQARNQIQQEVVNPKPVLVDGPRKSTVSRKRPSNESAGLSDRPKILRRKTSNSSPADRPALVAAKPRRSTILKVSPPNQRLGNASQSPRRSGLRFERLPSKLSVPIVVQLAQEHQEKYPVLTEDISRPEMYEDNWLSYQEAAITQLLNGLFKSAAEGQQQRIDSLDKQSTRKALLGLYQQPSFPLLYKRLQASLLYGALSIPKEVLAKATHLKDDVGLKRKFLSLWTETYQLSALKAAVEVVIGREITLAVRISNGSSSSENQERRVKNEKRSIEAFLETLLIRNEDAVRPKNDIGSIGSTAQGHAKASSADANVADFGSHAWSWRRTVLRSLMLIHLLDMGKANGHISDCLFHTSSPHKSTTSVLHALSNLLLPSLGDITRPLGHINYHPVHVQYPLEEYDYEVTNLATDLRDGVRLTRMVELLLYPPTSLLRQNDITVTMPTGDVLTWSSKPEDSWVLSHHLKFPCVGRAQKIYNVQIALAALQGVKGGTANHGGVKPEEIVDGHREKTVGLLWGLVSKWGLGTLVDWNEFKKEVQRLRVRVHTKAMKESGAIYEDEDYDSDEDEMEYMEGLERYTHLLKSWASLIAKLHGLRVDNLTTSFADGAVFEKIVNEYEIYFPTAALQHASGTSTQSRRSYHASGSTLEEKLRRLGCSNYFSSLFGRTRTTTHQGRVFDKDFTLASLAYLSSRLLQASVRGRAALTIQRFYRAARIRRATHQRATLLRLAHDCATVVRTRERVIGAAVVIQRAWRVCLGRRIDRLLRGVVGFQAIARGELVRRRVDVCRRRGVRWFAV